VESDSRPPEAAIRVVRAVSDRLVSETTAVARFDDSTHAIFPVAASHAEGEALRGWVVRERAQRTIEIGLGYAISTLFICEGLLIGGNQAIEHVVIDPYQESRFANCGLQFLEEAGVRAFVEHRSASSEIVLPLLVAEAGHFDLAFVDGNHRFDAVFVDLLYLGRLLRPGGVIFLDDYQLPGVRRAAAFYVANLGWSLEEISGADELHQWAVLRTSRVPDARPYDCFVDF
jgi:predicted O-methyltransferase YrrM